MIFRVLPLLLIACAGVQHKGPIVFRASSEITPQLVDKQAQKFNEIMGCDMIEIKHTEDKLERAWNGLNTITMMDDEERRTAGEEGRMTRYRGTEEVDLSFHLNDKGKFFTWVVYHELAHAIGVDHTEDPCDIMWSPEHPLWRWHSFQCTLNDADERLRKLKERIENTGMEYCPNP